MEVNIFLSKETDHFHRGETVIASTDGFLIIDGKEFRSTDLLESPYGNVPIGPLHIQGAFHANFNPLNGNEISILRIALTNAGFSVADAAPFSYE